MRMKRLKHPNTVLLCFRVAFGKNRTIRCLHKYRPAPRGRVLLLPGARVGHLFFPGAAHTQRCSILCRIDLTHTVGRFKHAHSHQKHVIDPGAPLEPPRQIQRFSRPRPFHRGALWAFFFAAHSGLGPTSSLVVRSNVFLRYDNGLRHFVRFRGLDPRQNIDAMRIRYLHGKAE